jgi:pilus assembly protein TadC
VWVVGLAVVGVIPLAIGGADRFSVPVALFMGVCTVASLLRQIGRLPLNTEVPGLVAAAGVVLLLTRILPLQPPKWMIEAGKKPPQRPPG